MSKWSTGIVVPLLLAALIVFPVVWHIDNPLREIKVYGGIVPTGSDDYTVEITERIYRHNSQLEVRMVREGILGAIIVTGIDAEADGKWEVIIYCGISPLIPTNQAACRTVERGESGWQGDYTASSDTAMKRIEAAIIRLAVKTLSEATELVWHEEFRVRLRVDTVPKRQEESGESKSRPLKT